jgi:hypothetical protein
MAWTGVAAREVLTDPLAMVDPELREGARRLVVREHEAPGLTEHDAKQANLLCWPPIVIPHHSLLRACPASAINCRA